MDLFLLYCFATICPIYVFCMNQELLLVTDLSCLGFDSAFIRLSLPENLDFTLLLIIYLISSQ